MIESNEMETLPDEDGVMMTNPDEDDFPNVGANIQVLRTLISFTTNFLQY